MAKARHDFKLGSAYPAMTNSANRVSGFEDLARRAVCELDLQAVAQAGSEQPVTSFAATRLG